jgi:hypothetical protein
MLIQRGAAVAERDRRQSWESVAAPSAAAEDRPLVADACASAAREDGWPFGQTRPRLLADAGGESSDAETVWKHGAADCGAFAAGRVAEVVVTKTSVRKEARGGGVSEKSPEGAIVPGLGLLAKDTADPSEDAGSGLDRKTRWASPLEGGCGNAYRSEKPRD